MVAYSFMKSFADKVESGVKPHTIRDDNHNDRHAKVGNDLQLYTGMRTKNCRKLRDAKCVGVYPIDIQYPNVRILIPVGWFKLSPSEINQLAIGDGFDSVDEFFDYFKEKRDRVLILWRRPEWLMQIVREINYKPNREKHLQAPW